MRAIILAAGKGTRLRPLTENIPKPLITVNGKAIIERQIECLMEKGIKEIIIVTGYLFEKFNYLKDKYDVDIKLIYNDKYDRFNNIYTMYLVRKYLRDAYVLDGDVYINKNFIKSDMKNSTYFGVNKNNFENEWVIYSEDKKIVNINIENAISEYKIILSGVSYWSNNDGIIIDNILEKTLTKNFWKNMYWDNIVKEHLDKINVYLNEIKVNECFEIDNLNDLKKASRIALT